MDVSLPVITAPKQRSSILKNSDGSLREQTSFRSSFSSRGSNDLANSSFEMTVPIIGIVFNYFLDFFICYRKN